jgi:vitamin B12 transporter
MSMLFRLAGTPAGKGEIMYPRLKPLAALLPALFSLSVVAETSNTLDPVVVTATRQPTRINELIADVTVIGREELDRVDPSATLGEVLGRAAGVEFSRTGGRGAEESVYIRGTNSGHVLVLVDGLRVGSATLGSTSLTTIPLAQIERIEIVRGAASAVYGTDAIGGVIQIITRPGSDAPRLQLDAGAGSYGAYQASLAHAGSVGGLRYALRAGGAGADGINAVSNPTSAAFNRDKDGYSNRNGSGHLAYALTDNAEVGGHYFASTNQTHYDASWPTANADWRTRHEVSGAGVFATLRPVAGWQSTLRLGRGEDRTVNQPSVNVGQAKDVFKTTQDQATWQNDVDLPLGRLLAVLERLEQKVESTNTYTLDSRTIDSGSLGWNAGWGAHRWQVNLRHDRNSQFGSRNTETFGYGYQIHPAWRLAASYGTAFKAPTFNDLYFPNTPFVGVGNPGLQPEFARNREIAVHFRQSGQRASLTYFHNNIENLIQWEETSPGSWFYTPMNVGEARIKGWLAEYEGRFGAWTVFANATAQSPEDAETGKLLTRRARRFGVVGLTHDSGPWQWGGEIKGSSERYDDAANTRRLDGYAVVNLHARYRLGKDWSFFVRADNVFDRKYEFARSSTTTYGNLGATVFAGLRYLMP